MSRGEFDTKKAVVSSLVVLIVAMTTPLKHGPIFAMPENGTVFLQALRCDSSGEADHLIERLRSGESFETLAVRKGPQGLRERAGYLGGVPEEEIHRGIREAISQLRPGEISDKIDLNGAYLIVRVLSPEEAASYDGSVDTAQYYLDLGMMLGEISYEQGEIEAYEKALERDPTRAEGYLNLGEVHRRKAIRRLEKVERNSDKNVEGAVEVVELLDEAIDYFKLALRADPDFAAAHYNLGLAYAAEGLLGLAVLELKEAARLRPEDGEIQKSLAAALFLSGEYSQAWQAVQRAREMGAHVAVLSEKIEEALDSRGREAK